MFSSSLKFAKTGTEYVPFARVRSEVDQLTMHPFMLSQEGALDPRAQLDKYPHFEESTGCKVKEPEASFVV